MELLFKKEVYEIIGAAFEVHKELGTGFLESVYEEAMCIECSNRKIPHARQVKIPVKYKNIKLNKEYIADLITYEKIIVELKCIPKLSNIEIAQVINYLKATGFELGVLINFGNPDKLEWKRIVRSL